MSDHWPTANQCLRLFFYLLVITVSKIHSLVLHIEQLLKQHQLLQQENQALRAQVAEQEEKLTNLEFSQNQQSYSEQDETTMQRLIDLVDHNLQVDEANNYEQ